MTRAMDQILQHASQVFNKKPDQLELCDIKPEILKLIKEIEVE